MKREVRLRKQLIEFCAKLHPGQRRAIKSALTELQSDRGDVIPLDGDLEGLHRLRVDRFRIILSYADDGGVDALFIERRALVYELFAAEHARRLIDPEA